MSQQGIGEEFEKAFEVEFETKSTEFSPEEWVSIWIMASWAAKWMAERCATAIRCGNGVDMSKDLTYGTLLGQADFLMQLAKEFQ